MNSAMKFLKTSGVIKNANTINTDIKWLSIHGSEG